MTSVTVETQIQTLRKRAKYLRTQSYLILFLIAGIIFGGSYFFYFSIQLSESTIVTATEDLKSIREKVTTEAESIRTILTERRITYDSSAQLLQRAVERAEGVTSELQGRFAAMEDELKRLRTNVDGLSSVDLGQVNQLLERRIDLASREYLDITRKVELGLRDYWANRTRNLFPLPSGCEFRGDYYKPGSQMLTCYDPRNEDFESQFTDCDISFGTNSRGNHRNIRCEEGFYQNPDFASLLSSFRGLVDLVAEFREELDDLTPDQLLLEFEFSEGFSSQRDEILGVAEAVGQMNEAGSLSEPQLNAAVFEELDSLSRGLDALISNISDVSEARTGEDALYYWVEKVSLRVMVVLLIIFLVQIFVNLFRYGTRLASFYEGRADALSLLKDSGLSVTSSEFHSLVMSLAPDSLDFGKSAKNPMDSAVELSRQIISVGQAQK